MFMPRPRKARALSLMALCLSLTGVGLPLMVAPAMAETAQTDPALNKRLSLARNLLNLDGSTDSVNQAMVKIGPLLEKALMAEPSIAALPADEKTKILELMSTALKEAIPQLIEKYAVHYANSFSEPELKYLVDQFQKPELKKFAAIKLSAASSMDSQFSAIGQQAAMNAMQKFAEWKTTKK
jgi:hypothetical protein